MPIYRSSELLQAQQNALAAAEGPDGSKASDAQAPDKKVGVSPLLCFFFFLQPCLILDLTVGNQDCFA